jgi:ATP-dependent DNA helicase RecQ
MAAIGQAHMAAVGQIDLQGALNRFGLREFRKGQQDVISHVIAGHDCLCVMPTGGGKSLCYQLPSLVRPGLTIVVSPLIALMKDQVDTLVKRGIKATLINSTLSNSEQNQRLDHVAGGHYSMVYVAPERLRNPKFLEAIRTTPVQLLAIDEAHCISEWGHDFRPDYHRLGRFREALGGVQTIALTATATPRVRQDIVDSLKLRVAKHFITGFARDNLYFGTVQCMGDREKDKQLMDFLATQTGTGIIYAATRKRCEALVEQIGKELKISVGAYHAGLMGDQRKLIQDQFMRNHLKVIVATNAFGMGIDKSDLRYVVHYNMPGTLEAFYQEAGRAGRDGLPSQCVLLYSAQDRYIQEFFIENANPPRELLKMVYEFLLQRTEIPIELTAEEIREACNAPATSEAVNSSLQILGKTAVMERLEVAGGLAMFRICGKLPSLVDLVPKDASVRRTVLRTIEKAIGDRRDEAVYIHPRWLMQQLQMDRDGLNRHLRELCKLESFEYVPPFRGRAIHFRRRDVAFDDLKIDHETLAARKKADYEKLDQMVSFAQSRACRQRTILEYFGDSSASNCGTCDRCQGKSGWPKMPEVIVSKIPSDAVEMERSNEQPVSMVVTPVPERTANSKKLPKTTPKLNLSLLPTETKSAYDLVVTILKAVERTHGYLSKTVLSQHLQGVESKAIVGLRLQRLPEFGILRTWKKAHASGFLDQTLDVGLLDLTELRMTKVTVCVSEKGLACIAGTESVPEPLLQYVHQCSRVSAIESDKHIDAPKLPAETKRPEQIEPKAVAPVEMMNGKQASRAATKTDQVEDDRPVRSIENLPTAIVGDASQGRDMSAPMIEDWRWTVRLVEHGYRLGEIALVRGKTPDSILEDLTRALQDGRRFSIDNLFDKRTQIAVRELHGSGPANAAPNALQSYPSLWRFIQKWLALR